MDDAAFDVGQAEVATAVRISQLLVVEAELVQDRSLQIVNLKGFSTTLKPKSAVRP